MAFLVASPFKQTGTQPGEFSVQDGNEKRAASDGKARRDMVPGDDDMISQGKSFYYMVR